MKLFLCVTALLAAMAASAPTGAKILGNRLAHPTTWTQVGLADDSVELSFQVALPQRNLDILEKRWYAVSTPGSPDYQDFMTKEEIDAIANPLPEVHDRVLNWIASSGARITQTYGYSILAVADVATLKKMFDTTFYTFQHADGRTIVRQYGQYSVPAMVADHVNFVEGLSGFPLEPRFNQKAANAAYGTPNDPPVGIAPQSIYAFYKFPANFGATGNGSQSVIQWEDQYFNEADLEDYGTEANIPVDKIDPSHIIGTNQGSEPGLEAELDTQMISATGRNVELWFWENASSAWLYGFATAFFQKGNAPPLTASMSYGWNEEDQCEQGIGAPECQQLGVDSKGFVAAVNAEFMKIGLLGKTLFAASGDSGVNGRTDIGCTENHFNPPYPAASPYLTAVGATEPYQSTPLSSQPDLCTKANLPCVGSGSERAVSIGQSHFASGGGFSNVAAMPDYQTSVVTNYLKTGPLLPPASYYNGTSRAFPDVAAFGSNTIIIANKSPEPVGGTSASSPMFCGLLGLLNDIAITKSGKPLGPANPLLYKMFADQPSCFNDITVGNNNCTEGGCAAGCKGFTCAVGWDPVTGLGTPNAQCMIQYVSNMFDEMNTMKGKASKIVGKAENRVVNAAENTVSWLRKHL